MNFSVENITFFPHSVKSRGCLHDFFFPQSITSGGALNAFTHEVKIYWPGRDCVIPVCHWLPGQERAACHLPSGSAWNADGEIKEVSKPFPPLSCAPPTNRHRCHLRFLAGWRNPPRSWTHSVPDVPPMPCLERVSEWLVPVYPSGNAGLRDVFLPAYLLLFPAAAIRAFNLGALNPGESGPNTSAESRGNFLTFPQCPSPPPSAFLHLLRFIWFCTCKRKKKQRTVLQCCTEKITWPLHKTEFI